MNPDPSTMQSFCQIILLICVVLGGLASYGISHFGEVKKQQEDAKQAYTGVLKSDSKVLLDAKKNIFPKLELGDGGAIFEYRGPENTPLFNILEDSYITISIEDRQLKVSVKIRDKNGIIAELVKNEWKVNPNNTFDRNYSNDALEVKDNDGDIVLQLKLVGDRVQFQGKFYDSTGKGVGLYKDSSGVGGVMEMTSPTQSRLKRTINPIFRYPSNLHLGEFLKNYQ